MAKKKQAPAADAATDRAPAEADPKNAAPAQGWRAGLELVYVLAAAILIALLIKTFVVDVYLIPSGSMETAIHGRPDGGDRILCSKLNYRFRDLKRWEVAVFDFPYASALAYDKPEYVEPYRGQNFVKRVVGLPGETLAIYRGDIWTRPLTGGEFRRAVKPDSAQRGMWVNVCEEDFADLQPGDLDWFWRISGDGEAKLEKGSLTLSPASGVMRMAYRPRVPAGENRDALLDIPGIPDRYVLEQPVQFKCRNVYPDGRICGHVYVKTFKTQNMLARCPKCGSLQPETSAIFYHRRSGLPVYEFPMARTTYAVSYEASPQGERGTVRWSEYHIVPDLRAVVDVVFASESSWYGAAIHEDNRNVQAIFNASGQIELRVNGAPSRPEHRAVAPFKAGSAHKIEFYMADGRARVFVDSETTPRLDVEIWRDSRQPSNLTIVNPRSSGVTLAAGGGDVILKHIIIDRDVFYYNGMEKPNMKEKFNYIAGHNGEAVISPDSFFPMGDHCPSSYDARSWGPVPLSNLKGPALLIWWPPERARVIPSP